MAEVLVMPEPRVLPRAISTVLGALLLAAGPLTARALPDAAADAPGAGRITAIAVDPTSTETIYAGGRGTGLWKSTDGGVRWEPLAQALPTADVDAVAVDPDDPSHVFFASSAGVFASLDGGRAWTRQTGQDLRPKGIDGGALIVRAQGPRTLDRAPPPPRLVEEREPPAPGPRARGSAVLYLSTQDGLRISRNGGVNWLPPVLGAGGIVESLVQDRGAPDHLLATVAGSPAAGVYETVTGGLSAGSWRRLRGCPEAPLPAFPTTPHASLWVAQSGATQWVSLKVGAHHELWRTTSRACFIGGTLERDWQLLSSGERAPCIAAADPGSPSHWSFLGADPTDARIVYKAGGKLCRSTDGGLTFDEVRGIHPGQHALVFHPLNPALLLLGNDGGLWRSEDRGRSFAFGSEGPSATQLHESPAAGPPRASRWVDQGR
jgi:hypothetical protein